MKHGDNEALCEVYDKAVSALIRFRGAHIRVVHDYVYQQAINVGVSKKQIAGTGGTVADYYLSERFKTTREQKLKATT